MKTLRLMRIMFGIAAQIGASVCLAQLPPTPKPEDAKTEKVPRLVVAERSKELGAVVAGDTIPVEWTLENQGQSDLRIERTVASCGCTVVHLSEEDRVIPPGGRLALKAEFRSVGRKGEQIKSVTVYSNDPAEPQLEVKFHARVDVLFEMYPPLRWVLRGIRRGQQPTDTLDITPGEGRQKIELLGFQVADPGLFTCKSEPLPTGAGAGHRFRIAVADNVPLGNLTSSITLKLKIGDLEKDVVVPIHAEVVVDLTAQPKMVAPPNQDLPRGMRLAPVAIRSLDKNPFDIREVKAGGFVDVSVEPAADKPAKTEYVIYLAIRNDAPPGPFGTMLEVKTSSLSQPVLRIPVFATVAAPLEIDPPLVILRADGTPSGTLRRVRVQVLPPALLDIASLKTDHPAVTATMDSTEGARMEYVRYLDVRLTGKLPVGTHHAKVTFTTSVPGAEVVELPVTIEIPG